jgi:hypothetical protein
MHLKPTVGCQISTLIFYIVNHLIIKNLVIRNISGGAKGSEPLRMRYWKRPWPEMTSHEVTWPEVTYITGSMFCTCSEGHSRVFFLTIAVVRNVQLCMTGSSMANGCEMNGSHVTGSDVILRDFMWRHFRSGSLPVTHTQWLAPLCSPRNIPWPVPIHYFDIWIWGNPIDNPWKNIEGRSHEVTWLEVMS